MKTKMNSRNDFPAMLKEFGLTRFAIEVGVAEGYFSWHLLDNWPGKVVMVDPWAIQDVPGYSVHGDNDQEARYQRILYHAKKYAGRAVPFRGTSLEGSERLLDNIADFVYIDANHTYDAVRQDIRLWWPKVVSGGILAGHDYLDGVIASGEYGVKRAVTEFASKNNLEVGVTKETDYPSWWIRKP